MTRVRFYVSAARHVCILIIIRIVFKFQLYANYLIVLLKYTDTIGLILNFGFIYGWWFLLFCILDFFNGQLFAQHRLNICNSSNFQWSYLEIIWLFAHKFILQTALSFFLYSTSQQLIDTPTMYVSFRLYRKWLFPSWNTELHFLNSISSVQLYIKRKFNNNWDQQWFCDEIHKSENETKKFPFQLLT